MPTPNSVFTEAELRYMKDQERHGQLDKNWTDGQLIRAAFAYIHGDGGEWPWGRVQPYEGSHMPYRDRLVRALGLIGAEVNRLDAHNGSEPVWRGPGSAVIRDVSHLDSIEVWGQGPSGSSMAHRINRPMTMQTCDGGHTFQIEDAAGSFHHIQGPRSGGVIKENPA